MKRIAAVLLLLGAMALAVTAGASADLRNDSTGPSCTDIVTGGAIYNVENAPFNTVTATIGYAQPTCKNVHYVLVISYVANGQTRVKVQSIKGDASTTPSISPIDGSTVYTLVFKINNVVADGDVCASTYTVGAGQVYDRSPEAPTECVAIPTDGGGGGGSGTF